MKELNREIVESAMLKLQTTKSFVKNNIGYVIIAIYNQIIEYRDHLK